MCQILTVKNYKLLRKIGEGGFGIVWLAQNTDNNELRALKEVTSNNIAGHEIRALRFYEKKLKELNIDGIVPILDIITDDKLYYAMPLCDGVNDAKPTDSNYEPLTLWKLIEDRKSAPKWFSKEEVAKLIAPIITTAGKLSQAEVLHRDIKPANILFFNGKPCIGDIGLLAEDTPSVSGAGTPDFAPPQWYREKFGNPDMWGCAATLFYLLTANNPDSMGRPSYMWQPCGKNKMREEDISVWQNFNRVLLRAVEEKPKNRYLRFEDFRDAVLDVASGKPLDEFFLKSIPQPQTQEPTRAQQTKESPKKKTVRKKYLYALAIAVFLYIISPSTKEEKQVIIKEVPAPQKITSEQIKEIQNYYVNLWKDTGEEMRKAFEKMRIAKTDEEKIKYFNHMRYILSSAHNDEDTFERFCVNFFGATKKHHKIKFKDFAAVITPVLIKRNMNYEIKIIEDWLSSQGLTLKKSDEIDMMKKTAKRLAHKANKIETINQDKLNDLGYIIMKKNAYYELLAEYERNAIY